MVTKSRPNPPIPGGLTKPLPPKIKTDKISAMQRLFTATLMATVLLFGFGAQACEKHLQGHQTSSNTAAEAAKN
jgi:hypothetical protein